MGRRPRYWLIRTKVGLVARVVAPRPRTSPWMKQVFPAPSSPTRATTAPGASAAASRSPAASVSSALVVRSSVVSATDPPERLGKRRDDVAGDQRLLADALGGDVAREPVEVDGRLERHARGHPASEEGAEDSREDVAVPPLAIPGFPVGFTKTRPSGSPITLQAPLRTTCAPWRVANSRTVVIRARWTSGTEAASKRAISPGWGVRTRAAGAARSASR